MKSSSFMNCHIRWPLALKSIDVIIFLTNPETKACLLRAGYSSVFLDSYERVSAFLHGCNNSMSTVWFMLQFLGNVFVLFV